MTTFERIAVAGALFGGLAGCDLARPYARPPAPIPASLPPFGSGPAHVAGPVILDARMIRLIDRALADNRDLRLTVEAAASAQAQLRIQRSAERPTISAGIGATVLPGTKDTSIASRTSYATVSEAGFEIDLYSRLKNLSRAAFADYLASAEGVTAARLAIRSEVAQAFVTLAVDKDLLSVARQTAEIGTRSLDINRLRYQAGLASGSDVQNAVIILEQAKADEQEQVTRIEQSRDALRFLVGGAINADDEPSSLGEIEGAIVPIDPASSSAVLLERPDVRQSEYRLQAAGLRVGAARAAFFPTVSLASAAGVAGTTLANLFTGGAASVILTPAIGVPLLGGPVRAGLAQARSGERSALDAYEKAIQAAFRDAADGLARERTISDERAAQTAVSDAAAEAYRLSLLRFKAGEGTFLAALVEQQALYDARRRQIELTGTDLRNRITLAAALASL